MSMANMASRIALIFFQWSQNSFFLALGMALSSGTKHVGTVL